MSGSQLIPTEVIERRIYLIRGQRVILDRDLAELYGVTTAALNQAVKRNSDRFPDDFMFQLDREKLAELEQRYDEKFRVVFDAIRQLMAQPSLGQQRRQIGFSSDEGSGSR